MKPEIAEKHKTERVIESLFLWFMCAAVIGWIYEVFLEVVVYRWGFSNRGVLFGPYCPVYGVGMLAFYGGFGWLMKKELRWKIRWLRPFVIFAGTGLVATIIELSASYLLEWFTGAWPWQTYARDYAIQFQGRIALSPSVRFGIGGVLFLYLLQPLFRKMTDRMSDRVLRCTALGIGLILILDLVYTIFFR